MKSNDQYFQVALFIFIAKPGRFNVLAEDKNREVRSFIRKQLSRTDDTVLLSTFQSSPSENLINLQ